MILAKIREKTLNFHDDFTSWAANILNGTISLEQYKFVLKTFYGFYYPLEEKIYSLEDVNNLELSLEKRRKTRLLVKDMKALGITEAEIDSISLCEKLPTLNSAAQALGCMYVVEGATLGGQFIAKKLHEIFDLNKDNGCAFFNSYNEELRPLWTEFCDVLNKYADYTQIEDPIVESSINTYHSFNDWLFQIKQNS